MRQRIRPATADDAEFLIEIITVASEGVVPQVWGELAPPGMTGHDIGLALVTSDTGPFSYTRGTVLEADGAPAAGMISYRMMPEDAADEPGMPDIFRPVTALERQAIGNWYINVIATRPAMRGRGLAQSLVARTEELARAAGCAAVSLIVGADNEVARRLYDRAGFLEIGRAPFDVSAYNAAPTEAVLISKPV